MEIQDAAVKRLKEMIAQAGKSGFLRIFMSEGCCGPSVAMELVDGPGADDLDVTKNDFKVFVHKDAAPILEHAVIDCDADGEIIVKGLPEPEGGCGCGH